MASATVEGPKLDLRTICEVLGFIKTKWFAIGIQLGIPRNKLLEFEEERDPLSAVIDYWLRGNVTESVVPISWKSIVTALKSQHVQEPGLASEISKKYEPQGDTNTEDSNLSGCSFVHFEHEQTTQNKFKVKCEMCSEGKTKAHCLQCNMFICAECVKQHLKMKVLSGHKISIIEELTAISPSRQKVSTQQDLVSILPPRHRKKVSRQQDPGSILPPTPKQKVSTQQELAVSNSVPSTPRQKISTQWELVSNSLPPRPGKKISSTQLEQKTSTQRTEIEEELKAIRKMKCIPNAVKATPPSQQKMPETQVELRVNKHKKSIPEKLELLSPADHMKKKAKLVKSGKPAIYQLPLTYIHQNSHDGLFKCRVGPFSTAKPEKILMLLGATGAGKSTLINGIVNYVFGVKWDDNFRFQIISDEGDQSHSQTKNITAYSLCSTILPYTLTIIDTPGFGDTSGIERDKRIAAQIKHFFSDTSGVDTLHGIGFVTQASLARLTITQRYIFDAVLSIFGKDIGENIFLLATFADADTPPVLQATKTANIPYQASFKFNNSSFYASNDPAEMFSSMFWKMGYSSFEKFFVHFPRAEPKSLALTREVLRERNKLDTFIPGLQKQFHIGLGQLEVLKQEERVLKQHEAELNAKSNFTYTIDVTRFRKKTLPAGVYTATCMSCNFSCHSNCTIQPDEDKTKCSAMDCNGYCKICPDRCHKSLHSSMPYIFEYYTVTETRISDDLKRHYDSAKSGKECAEAMIAENEKKLSTMQVEVYMLIEQARESIKRLEEIALKPNPLTELEYLDLLIESEKVEANPGHERRIAQYMQMRKNAEILKNVVPKVSTNEPKSKTWWETVGSLFSTSK